MAFSVSAQLFVACYSVWDDEAADEANVAWTRDTVDALKPFTIGHYVGEADLLADRSRVERSFAPPNWERLQAVKRRFDPQGVFHSYPSPD